MRPLASPVPAAALSLVALFALHAAGCSDPAEPPPPPSAEELLRSDDRVSWLLEPCARSEHYDRDTSDLVPLLVGKLALAEPGPLQRTKEALIEIGEEAVPELARLLNRHFTDPLGTPFVQGAAEVLSGIADPAAREPVLRALEHPAVSIRAVAVRGLRRHHARPEDYELLRAHFEVEALDLQKNLALALFAADPGRAEEEYLDWVEAGAFDGVWRQVLALVARSRRDETLERCRVLVGAARPDARPWLAAAAARAGDADALETLRADLRQESGALRTNAAEAAVAAGLVDELGPVLLDDPDPKLRGLAASALAAAEPTEQRDAWLLRGLDDPSPDVRSACLVTLVRRDDPAAVDRLLFLLGGSRGSFASAVLVLQQSLEQNPGITPRVLDRLRARQEAERHLPLAKRAALYQAIGVLPSAEAARILLELGRTAGEEIQGLRAHRWAMLTAANTGVPGRSFLREALGAETDPLRRIDLIWAVTSQRDELSRDVLLELVEDESTHPYERLFCAERLPNVAPPAVAAPLLKRVTLRVRDDAARRGMQCLLWRWY